MCTFINTVKTSLLEMIFFQILSKFILNLPKMRICLRAPKSRELKPIWHLHREKEKDKRVLTIYNDLNPHDIQDLCIIIKEL